MKDNSKKLLENIQRVFVEQHKYQFDKYVPEFKVDDKFLGDCYNITILEPKGTKPPRFYHTFSPFDVISNAAPDQALVFENGNMLLNVDFADYVCERTGAMDALVLRNTGVKSLDGKKILYLGSGKVAQASLCILKAQFPEISEVDCINNSGNYEVIRNVATKVGVVVNLGNIKNVAEYDYIFCHTNTQKTLLTKGMLSDIKHGAIITTFISSTEHGEVADEYYDSTRANIIGDWEKTTDAKDLKRALDMDLAQKTDIIFLKDLFSGARTVDNGKQYTIYRSIGTPMQNLAVLQLLVDNNS